MAMPIKRKSHSPIVAREADCIRRALSSVWPNAKETSFRSQLLPISDTLLSNLLARFPPFRIASPAALPVSTPPMAEQTASTQARPGAVTALLLLLVINLFNYIDRQVLAAVEPPLSAEFGLDSEQAGLLASAFLYAYMIGAPICGRLAERMSRWWIIAISVSIWSLASGWTGLARSE